MRHGALWAAGVYTLIALSLVYPIFGGGYLVNPMSDMYTGAAYRAFGGAYLHATGHFAQWNPYVLGGLPFVAAQSGDMFYPVVLLRALLPIDLAVSLSFAIHLVLAGLFTYVFLRAYGFSFFPALIGGVGYMLAGQVASLVSPGHDGKLYVSALAPLLLWALLRGVRDGVPWAWGVVALTTGLCIVSPHYQMTYYLGLLAIAWTLYLTFRSGELPSGAGRLDRRQGTRRLAWAAGAAVLGLAVAAVQILPLAEYVPFSPRGGGGRGYAYATSWSMPPEELLSSYVPQFIGVLERYWGRNPFKLHSDYLGAALLVLAGLAAGARRRRGLLLFWLAAAGLAVLVSLGGYTPFYHLWYLMPMMHLVRAPAMVYFVVCLATATAAAIGVERLLEMPLVGPAASAVGRYMAVWTVAAIGIALFATAGGLAGVARELAGPERYDAVSADVPAMLAGAWRSALFVVAAAACVFAFARGRLSAAQVGWALVTVVAVDDWTVVRPFFRFSPGAAQLYAADPTITYLQHLPRPGRVVALPLAPLAVQGDPVLEGDGLMMHDVHAVTGHQGNELETWVELAGAKSPSPAPRVTSAQFRHLTNTEYWLTNAELPAVVPELGNLHVTRRVGPVTDAVGNTVSLYHIDEDNPPAWVAGVVVKAAPSAILTTVLDARFDRRSAALFDSTLAGPGATVTAPPVPLVLGVTTLRYEPGHLTFRLDAAAPTGSALVVSENYFPGWKATVDGRGMPVARADYTFIGVPLPAGARTVDLIFRDAAFERGATVSVAALVAAILLIAAGLRRNRVRSA